MCNGSKSLSDTNFPQTIHSILIILLITAITGNTSNHSVRNTVSPCNRCQSGANAVHDAYDISAAPTGIPTLLRGANGLLAAQNALLAPQYATHSRCFVVMTPVVPVTPTSIAFAVSSTFAAPTYN